MAKPKGKPIVIYLCEKCSAEFETWQGSRRKLCPKCLVLRVTAGKKG